MKRKILVTLGLLVAFAGIVREVKLNSGIGIGIGVGGGWGGATRWGGYGWGPGWGRGYGWGPGIGLGYYGGYPRRRVVYVQEPQQYVEPRVVERRVVRVNPQQVATANLPEEPVSVTITNESPEITTVYYDNKEKTFNPGERATLSVVACDYEVYYRQSKISDSFKDCSTNIVLRGNKPAANAQPVSIRDGE